MLASRISYVGDLGWELYVPMADGAKLWDVLWEAGRAHGVVPAGIGVYGTTGRIEKCYRAFGFELDDDYTVVEADMAWGKVKDQDFIGKEAYVSHRESDPVALCCTLTVEDHTSKSGIKRYMLGREPILARDGTAITDAKGRRSYVTTAGAAPSVCSRIARSAPIAMQSRSCSSASAGPSVSTTDSPPPASTIRTASSTAHSSCGLIVKPRWRVWISCASSLRTIRPPVIGTRLTQLRILTTGSSRSRDRRSRSSRRFAP